MISSEQTNVISNIAVQSKVQKMMCLRFERYVVEHLQSQENNQNFLSFDDYIESLENSEWKEIIDKYPAIKKHLHRHKKNFNNELVSIFKSFKKDYEKLTRKTIVSSNKLEDINIQVADLHNGKTTAILQLQGGENLVYKPLSGKVTEAYNLLLDWINDYIPLGDYKYEIIEGENYHWLEFIENKECLSEEDLQKYYVRAGVILCITFLLNALDYHYENIIANGATPILIDHETILQPLMDKTIRPYFRSFGKEGEEDTVLDSLLLPNTMEWNKKPMGICGFGYHKQTQMTSFQKMGINRYTKDWKIVVDNVTVELNKQNIPKFMGKKVFPNKYSNEIIKGFESCYRLIMRNKRFLVSQKSPAKAFENAKIRFIWRSTSVYNNIQTKMNLPKYMKSHEEQERIVRKYLKQAYQNVAPNSSLWLIYEHEVTQMLRGDIPYFEINTSSRDLKTEHGIIKDFFELSCMENFERKLAKFSLKDLEHQKLLIKESLLM